jgi:hypothetical protein
MKLGKRNDERADVGTLLGLLTAGRGIGAVASGPLRKALISRNLCQAQAFFG